jgi:hypothetical protein
MRDRIEVQGAPADRITLNTAFFERAFISTLGHARGRRRMGKPVVGEVVVLLFPQTDLQAGKRRPALVVANSSAK